LGLYRGDEAVGALQITTARYKGGKPPGIDIVSLRGLLADFMRHHSAASFDHREELDLPTSCSESYLAEGAFHRVWYISDGWNVLFANYVCDFEDSSAELDECGLILRSVEFLNT
jgi:hypothetical protein